MIYRTLVVIVLLIDQLLLYGQVTTHTSTINFLQANDSYTITMNGLLDGKNTFTYPTYKAFEPMVSLKINNTGIATVHNPRVTINAKRNWYDINSMTAECFDGVTTDKERALALWKFVRNNRVHRFESEYGAEITDPIKFLGVYGYGMCYNTNYSNTFIAQGVQANSRSYSPRGRHFISEINFGSGYMLIDSDIETFYLKSDNTTLASYEDIYHDKNLIKRVHHYGKAEQYNFATNESIAYKIYGAHAQAYYFGYYPNFHTLDCSLRPNESIEYYWKPGRLYHSFENVHNADSTDIANGRFVYSTNFLNADLKELIDTAFNITSYAVDGQVPNLHAISGGTATGFVIKITSPFVILNGTVKGNFQQQTINDAVKIFFSKDSIDWSTVWTSSQTGNFEDSLELYDQIQTLYSTAIYNYFLKIELSPQTSNLACGIDSLTIITDFQVSRFFLPTLQLANNIVNYTDTDTSRNINVTIAWKESSENSPPAKIMSPIFPADSSQVDSLRFTFSWNDATDADNIIDYEFQLSDRADMKYPLMPSFEVYTSKTNNGQALNHFSIPLDGMLNSGTTYYWRVKAKDAQGAWGSWSPAWSFIPNGPMPPVNGSAAILQDSMLVIRWNKNQMGDVPAYYEIHASDEWLGFSISSPSLLDTTSADSLVIPINCTIPKTFYRIVAVDGNGSKSGVSDVIQIPYPYVYVCADTVMPYLNYSFALNTNQLYVKDIDIINMYYQNIIIQDTVDIQILSKPDWLNLNDNVLSGVASYEDLYPNGISDTVFSIQVQFTGRYSHIQNNQIIKLYVKEPVITSASDKINANDGGIQVSPNPFKDKTAITYTLKNRSDVKLTVYNIYGQKIQELTNGIKEKGKYETSWNSHNMPGIYILLMEAKEEGTSSHILSKKIIKTE